MTTHTATRCNTHCHALQHVITHDPACDTIQNTKDVCDMSTHSLQFANLQHLATLCNTLLCACNIATYRMHFIATHCNTHIFDMLTHSLKFDKLQLVTTHCNTLQHSAYNIATWRMQHTATHCDTLQHTATHCNTLQHTATQCVQHCNLTHATHCNTLLQTWNVNIFDNSTNPFKNDKKIICDCSLLVERVCACAFMCVKMSVCV